MRKLQEITDPTSCLNQAGDDEPLFVLRGNDECAPMAIRTWVAGYVQSKGGWALLSSRQLNKVKEAHSIAENMEAWKKRNPK